MIIVKKKKIFNFFTLLLLAFISLTVFSSCERRGAEEQKQTLKEKIDNVVSPYIKVGAVVGVIYKGVRQVFSYGRKAAASIEPPDANSIFEIGSITKTFTATILADMHLKGIVNLEDAVGDYLPADKVTMPSYNGIEISFEHLATHTSGLPRLPDNLFDHQDDPDDPYASYTTEHMYEFLNSYTLSYIGTHVYSNLGVGLLGHTLGLAQGISYEELLFKTIFNTLGMKNSSLFLTEKQKADLALPHDENLYPTSNWNAGDCFQGAGSIKTSLNDMFKYLEANMGLTETPLKAAMELAQEFRVKLGGNSTVCLAWFTDVLSDGQTIIEHNGGTGGYFAFIGFNKSLANGVIFLCNIHHHTGLYDIGYNILKILKSHEE